MPPAPIRLLPEATVNRIAAGEVVQRPSNAIKELLENSLDGGAGTVRITVRDGGLKSIVIADNGIGIARDDLAVLCHRHTTSKICNYNDLAEVATFGFRGEALASISHVAHLSVLTKTADDTSGYRALYLDGELVPMKAGDAPAPKTAAANDGTTVMVQDLFYNAPQRRKALRSTSEEYARIYDVVARYAIHNSGKSFVLKKADNVSPDISTLAKATTLENIAAIFSDSIRRELLPVQCESEPHAFKVDAYVSNANFSSRKPTFILFINDRLVQCPPLRKALETLYSNLLPKGGHPFIYINMHIESSRVDVNVHPTKREVQFLDQDEIIEIVCDATEAKLSDADQSRTFMVQTFLPGAVPANTSSSEPLRSTIPTSGSVKVPPHKLVRTDHNARTLDEMLGRVETSTNQPTAFTSDSGSLSANAINVDEEHHEENDDEADGEARIFPTRDSDPIFTNSVPLLENHPVETKKSAFSDTSFLDSSPSQFTSSAVPKPLPTQPDSREYSLRKKIPLVSCQLTSVNELRRSVSTRRHRELETVIKNHTFVAIVDMSYNISLIQHMTKLYLINHSAFGEELFYQLGLRQFGGFGRLKLVPSPSLRDLVTLAVENTPDTVNATIPTTGIIDRVCDIWMSNRYMMEEYFSITLNETGELRTLPLLLPDYFPNLDKLPLFLLRAAVEVNWTEEKECFDGFLRELALFCSPSPLETTSNSFETLNPDSEDPRPDGLGEDVAQTRWNIQHVLFPAMKQMLEPTTSLNDSAINQVASLESLYKVFERC